MLKALSLWEPWASLVACGAKRVETRSWSTSHRGEIAIHAACRWGREQREIASERAFVVALGDGFEPKLGSVLAVANLIDVREITPSSVPPHPESAFGDFTPGRFAWFLADVRAVAPPVPSRGAQGMFLMSVAIERMVRERLEGR